MLVTIKPLLLLKTTRYGTCLNICGVGTCVLGWVEAREERQAAQAACGKSGGSTA